MDVKKWDVFELCNVVREAAFSLHKYLRHGHMEKVYENGLAHRLRKMGLDVIQQHPLQIFDEDGTVLGDYFADLIIEGFLVAEIKAVREIDDAHVAQILGYLAGSRHEHGLLINFGAPIFEIKKYVLTPRR